MLSPGSVYYSNMSDWPSNPIDIEGVIVHTEVLPKNELCIKVKWANDEYNYYNTIDLIDIDAIVEQELLGEDNVENYN